MQNRNRNGFTLIELLIVVVIIGILAAIAIPKFATTKEKAYLASMKSDLRNLATAQEGYASDNNGTYSTAAAPSGYAPSSGVAITVSGSTPAGGWGGVATHASTAKKCAIYVNMTPVTPATTEGEPKCDS
jgi:prepilin-type N-terminal cleavage/methylation domain-containing protein